jgi:fatty-acyl-CoA synthase
MLIAAEEYLPAITGIRGELTRVERCIALTEHPPVGWMAYRQWIASHATTAPGCPITDDLDIYQMYTSGTTGHPKGAVLTHRVVTAHLAQATLVLGPRAGERGLLVVPLYHAAGAFASFMAIAWGGSLYLQHEFVPAEVVRALSDAQISWTVLVPAMIQACLVTVPDVAARCYEALRLIGYGASPIAESTLRWAMAVFHCDFVQGYGMTETTSGLTYLMPADHQRALREKPELLLSAGRPLPGTEVRIVDAQDCPVPTGTIGEVVVRGPQLMRGYWHQPEASAEALRGGWMHTGDAGRLDDEGYLYIQDRITEMIVSGGENVYPHRVEQVLFQHPAIADAAVIGVPDAQWGETVKAMVVVRPGMTATAEDIIEFCRGQLGGFERPRSVDFVAELPRNASGKVLKWVLREPYWIGHQRRVAGA